MKHLLITGAGGSGASNVIASLRLSKEKYMLIGCDISKYHLELTEGLDRKYLIPRTSDSSYFSVLHKIIKKEKIDFIHPQTEQEVLLFAKNPDKVRATFLLPSLAAIELCQNKIQLNLLLKDKKIPAPDCAVFSDEESFRSSLALLLKKNAKVWLRATKGAGSKAALPIDNPLHGLMWIDYWSKHKGLSITNFMIAEYLPGREYAFQSLWYKGKLITSMARERLEYLYGFLSPSGQSSTPQLAKTVHNNRVNDIATRAILAADKNPYGVYCVDLKENSKQVPCVTEINVGRFFTTSNFFSVAGINMPELYIKLGLGKSLPRLKQYNPLPKGWYWVRMVDMGYKLVKGEKWTSQKI